LSVETSIFQTRARRPRQSVVVARRALYVVAPVVLVVGVVGLVFAGSASTLAAGTTIDGVDVGGLAARQAVSLLEAKEAAVASVPVTFTAAGKEFRYSASELGVQSDWHRAVADAQRAGDGFWPVQAFRRLRTRVVGHSVSAPVSAYPSPLQYAVAQIATAVDVPYRDAALVRHGLTISVAAERAGRSLNRGAASAAIVRALGGLRHPSSAALDVASAAPHVTALRLAGAARRARIVVSAPVSLQYGTTTWRLPRWRLAQLLSLPSNGATRLTIAGPAADAYFARLGKTVGRKPVDATFRVLAGNAIGIVRSKPGLALDTLATSHAILVAASSVPDRHALVVVRTQQPARTTEKARAMGIVGEVSSYSTTYGGTPGRLHNVALVAKLIDDKLIAPGATFSFNKATGERTAAKGFEVAPVIINGEVTTGLGGGVCQVSTTTFNAAFDAGLPITERTNHALFISHYPLGRDATVNYPDVDLKFGNDTGHWLLVRTFVSTGALTVTIYGTPQNRRVESEVSPLSVVGPMPVTVIKDPALKKGEQVIDHVGAPATATTVTRKVYSPDGKLLHDDVWNSHYVGDTQIVRVGTKKPPKKKPVAPVPALNAPARAT
jgi:vancomycin resistance protein YoaR